MITIIPLPIQGLEQEQIGPSKSYQLDLSRGRIFPVGTVDGMEAVQQFIKKALLTPRFRCLIYDNQYGSELKQTIIADDATREFIESDLPRLVRDALLIDSRIFDVYGFTFDFDNDEVQIRFTASTIFGESVIEEVI